VRGRRVRQILITSKFSNAPVARYWVDAGTYRPVRVALLAGVTDPFKVGFPVLSVALIADLYSMSFGPVNGPYSVVTDFAEYRYLPRTPANRKLADIRSMHPGVPIL
jgi:hypothetical protein